MNIHIFENRSDYMMDSMKPTNYRLRYFWIPYSKRNIILLTINYLLLLLLLFWYMNWRCLCVAPANRLVANVNRIAWSFIFSHRPKKSHNTYIYWFPFVFCFCFILVNFRNSYSSDAVAVHNLLHQHPIPMSIHALAFNYLK